MTKQDTHRQWEALQEYWRVINDVQAWLPTLNLPPTTTLAELAVYVTTEKARVDVKLDQLRKEI